MVSSIGMKYGHVHGPFQSYMASFLLISWVTRCAVGLSTTYYREASSARAKLLRVVEDELSRGRFASETIAGSQRIERAVSELESSRSEEFCFPRFPRDLMTLEGVWRLKYTNNTPRPPPREVRDVIPLLGPSTDAFQKFDVIGRRVINIVCLRPPAYESLGETLLRRMPIVGKALSTASIRIDLDHAFTVDGEDRSRQLASTTRLAINLERISRKLEGADLDTMPAIFRDLFFAPSQTVDVPEPFVSINSLLNSVAGKFDTTYCDRSLRISRGISPFGNRELRIFFRCDESDVPLTPMRPGNSSPLLDRNVETIESTTGASPGDYTDYDDLVPSD